MPEHYSRIFLLSHMRAYTSLAGHILGSHPWINGYFEMHISYEDAAALDRQLEVLQRYEALKAGSHYVFDKLLHNDYRLYPERLGPVELKLLVSLLAPEQAIKSIVDLFSRKAADEPYASPAGATTYYIERVQALADFCQSAGRPYYYYDAELLQAAPEQLLPGLTDWLALDTPLSERYQLFSQTGRARLGDTSDRIRSGHIERTPTDYSQIHLPGDELNRARVVYRDCRARIVANAAGSLTAYPRHSGESRNP